MYIIFLKFGPNRSRAGQWMTEHMHWIQQGIDDGVFLAAGSLDDARGGAVLAASAARNVLLTRVQQDPFVVHGVVVADVHAIAPSLMAPGMAELLGHGRSPKVVS